jgi:predicted ribosome quality control (RQC) complex YloA/Tae2 family protein
MMLSISELRRAARILEEEFSGAALKRIFQPAAKQLVLSFEGTLGKRSMLLSCDPEYARVCRAETLPKSESSSTSFCEYIRAHLVGTVLSGIETSDEDRRIGLRLQSRSDCHVLLLSILGARSNVYLLESGGRLVHAMRPLDATRRELKLGELWSNPRSAAPSAGIDRWEAAPDELYLETIANSYRQLEEKREAEVLARRIEQAIRKEQTFLERKLINLQEDLGNAKLAEIYRQKGELLKSVLHSVKTGDGSIAATDYQTGEIVEIPLDPKLSPAANLESYFTRYQKETRGVQIIQQQLETLEASRTELEVIEQKINEMRQNNRLDIEALENISLLPGIRRLIMRHTPKQKSPQIHAKSADKRTIPARLQPKRYKTQDGLEIWVGRNDEGNDYLTTRLARGNDLFFHLEGYPGSHVVLRTEGRTDPPSGALLDACELAVHFSKLKNAGRADVHVAPIKDVKKPKGAKPGLVYVRKGKIIHLKRDPKRMQGILASRLNE